MPIYRPKNKAGKQAPEYIYDFRINGRRFSGGTCCTSRPEALKVERAKRIEAQARLVEEGIRETAPMTVDLAAARFWNETGQFYKGGAGTTFASSLVWLVTHLGKDTLLQNVTGSRVADLVYLRRSGGVSPATVNRTVTEPLRRILRRASDAWGQAVQKISWRDHLLAEPRERVRSLTDDEERRLLSGMPEDYRPVVAFAIRTGFRLAECIGLTWDDIDFGGRRIIVRGKGGKVASIPLTPAVRELLWPLKGNHSTAVFTYAVAKARSRDGVVLRQRGERQPVTYSGMKSIWRRANRNVADFRFHDTRHTAATRLLRSSGNLKLVQKLLRHDEITTTTKYAHADDDDLRNAMERAERQEKRHDTTKSNDVSAKMHSVDNNLEKGRAR